MATLHNITSTLSVTNWMLKQYSYDLYTHRTTTIRLSLIFKYQSKARMGNSHWDKKPYDFRLRLFVNNNLASFIDRVKSQLTTNLWQERLITEIKTNKTFVHVVINAYCRWWTFEGFFTTNRQNIDNIWDKQDTQISFKLSHKTKACNTAFADL